MGVKRIIYEVAREGLVVKAGKSDGGSISTADLLVLTG